MTLGEIWSCSCSDKQTEGVADALLELLSAARRQECVTLGVYEAAQLLNVDPDSVVLCVLAADEEHEHDVALQIHFTLLQAFCREIHIDVLRVSGMRRLAETLGEPPTSEGHAHEPKDLHCVLVTNPQVEHRKLSEVGRFCRENLCRNQWLPHLSLHER
ncbi:growth arrest and DNA-damage-inducible, beta b [Pangasianodon hypophthalmus]|uniref:growth arrest and DNA-damage-inducible, beta b n=1 Tax=Pangasianodon hypophthalmus TaxID=310915 RepID=UPI00147CF8AA|nr:growth arrest and DNA-damage-inducible, beta b [Pangasianodon hypophthalmus]